MIPRAGEVGGIHCYVSLTLLVWSAKEAFSLLFALSVKTHQGTKKKKMQHVEGALGSLTSGAMLVLNLPHAPICLLSINYPP